MKTRAIVLPAWIEDERSLLHYLMGQHDGHPYAEELLEGVCLITSWILIAISVLAVLAVVGTALV